MISDGLAYTGMRVSCGFEPEGQYADSLGPVVGGPHGPYRQVSQKYSQGITTY
jgi:hypothetical protein